MSNEIIYDKDATYLYNTPWGYEIVKITKINEKSLKLSPNGRLLWKTDFDKLYKLNDEELLIYNNEVIRRLSTNRVRVSELVKLLKSLTHILNEVDTNRYINVNSEELQKEIDNTTEALNKQLTQPFDINGVKYYIDSYDCCRLKKYVEPIEEEEVKIRIHEEFLRSL